jgi:hypothetical protein
MTRVPPQQVSNFFAKTGYSSSMMLCQGRHFDFIFIPAYPQYEGEDLKYCKDDSNCEGNGQLYCTQLISGGTVGQFHQHCLYLNFTNYFLTNMCQTLLVCLLSLSKKNHLNLLLCRKKSNIVAFVSESTIS